MWILNMSMTVVPREPPTVDMINHPPHYNNHPSGVECIEIVEHMPFNIGSAMQYLWRCDEKHPCPYDDLEKALWFVRREIRRRRKMDQMAQRKQAEATNGTTR
jgi:hypothetical protein